jgi:hypothetical protein
MSRNNKPWTADRRHLQHGSRPEAAKPQGGAALCSQSYDQPFKYLFVREATLLRVDSHAGMGIDPLQMQTVCEEDGLLRVLFTTSTSDLHFPRS